MRQEPEVSLARSTLVDSLRRVADTRERMKVAAHKLMRVLGVTFACAWVLTVPALAFADPGTGQAGGVQGHAQATGLLRVVLGLAGALGLAAIAAHPVVRRIERRLGITVIISSGLPFLALGVLFRLPSVNVLGDEVLRDLRPALEFGLGWLGFVVGTHFDVRELDALPNKTSSVVVAESLVPIISVTAVTMVVLLAFDRDWTFADVHSVKDVALLFARVSLRDALALGACAAPAAPIAAVALALGAGSRGASLVARISTLNDISGIFVMALLCAFYRPTDAYAAWHLPHVAWLFVTLGLGGILGILTYLLLRGAQGASQEIALLIGATALSAGMSGYLGISPLVSCALAGALLTNLPFEGIHRVKSLMRQVERPLYLIFLLIAGALWEPFAWQGWILAPAFLVARLAGKMLGSYLGKHVGPKDLPDAVTLGLALSPQSPISIATIVGYVTLYRATSDQAMLSWLMSACVGSAVFTEGSIQLIARLRGGLRFDPNAPSMSASAAPPSSRELP